MAILAPVDRITVLDLHLYLVDHESMHQLLFRAARSNNDQSGSSTEEFKIPTVLMLLPKSHERELKLTFAMGLTDYRKLTQQIMGYSQQIRFEGAYSRGDNDMDVGFLEACVCVCAFVCVFVSINHHTHKSRSVNKS